MVKEDINVDSVLRDIENFLRNNIMFILKNKYGSDWEKYLGVSEERLSQWKDRMSIERKRLKGNVVENRLIYYSDFYDLKTIINKNWEIFKNCFSDKKVFEYQLSQLESYRNPNAHNRDLLEYQKYLLVGISGEIKSGIMKYRGSLESKDTFFPELDSVNINGKEYKRGWIHFDGVFRPGDKFEVSVYLVSPNTQKIYFSTELPSKNAYWSDSNHFIINIDDSIYGKVDTTIYYKSDASYHMCQDYDGAVIISYTVVPNEI